MKEGKPAERIRRYRDSMEEENARNIISVRYTDRKS